MPARTRLALAMPALALLLLSLACGSSNSLPSDASSATAGGATIVGVVNAGSAGGPNASADSSQVTAVTGGIRVTVVGTQIAALTNASGEFLLQGVPGGNVTLHFSGSGIDAQLQISGLVAGQTLTISVQVSGSHASFSGHGSGRAEFSGAVESIKPPRLTVAGRAVMTDARTEIRRGDQRITLSQLAVGETVKVEGRTQADGTVLAEAIKTRDPGDETSFEGAVESIRSPLLRVAGRSVMTDANTRIKRGEQRIALTDLKVGERVRVEGRTQPDGSVLAREIKAGKDDHDDDFEFRGTVDSINPPNLRVAGRLVVTDSATRIERDNRRIGLTDLRVGERVEVEGTRRADGSVLARKIEVDKHH